MRFGSIAQRQLAIDAHAHFAAANPRENFACTPHQFLTIGDVVAEAGTGQVGAVFCETRRIKWRHRSTRLPEQRQQPPASDAVQTLVKRGDADRVVDNVTPFPSVRRITTASKSCSL